MIVLVFQYGLLLLLHTSKMISSSTLYGSRMEMTQNKQSVRVDGVEVHVSQR